MLTNRCFVTCNLLKSLIIQNGRGTNEITIDELCFTLMGMVELMGIFFFFFCDSFSRNMVQLVRHFSYVGSYSFIVMVINSLYIKNNIFPVSMNLMHY
jgi:hypothetical protein